MQQQALFAEAAADEDTDLRDAIAAFSPVVVRIRQLSASHFALPETKVRERAALEDEIQSLLADIGSRAERLGTTVDELLRLINADLAASKANTFAPTGEFARHLADENCRAVAQERQVQREVGNLQKILATAVEARVAADRACAGFVAGYARRGETKATAK
ncbi:hypothetical protein [Sphingomonas sp. GM_Shp_1]|uniref:hypothetical protein n=1 Tax=Sphingomonas sp. GM_Shp_1 TaxID=2937381 RepID=UPI00226BA56A|nr:hypothetical protein [Sphingomonas sp. GM_Shp_1]